MLTGLPIPGRATTLGYTSDSIVEFDLFHQWIQSGGILWDLPSEPAPADWATLHIEVSETLGANGSYNISRRFPSPAGYISDFTLAVETDRGRYEVNEFIYRDFELYVKTGATGSVDAWSMSWGWGIYPSDSDHFWMESSGGHDEVSWLWEYLAYPEQEWPVSATGGGSFTDGRMAVVQSLSQNQLAPVPLPAPALFLLSGLAAFLGLRRIRPLEA